MELIPPDSREALVLRLWQKLSFAEMGERLGIEPNAASMRHHRAIRRLAAKINELRRNGVSAALD